MGAQGAASTLKIRRAFGRWTSPTMVRLRLADRVTNARTSQVWLRQTKEISMEVTISDRITVPRSRKPDCRQFIGGSDARIVISWDEAALIRLWTGGHSRVHGAISPTAQAQFLRRSEQVLAVTASYGQRQIAAKLTTFMAGVQIFMKTYAVMWQKLYVRFSEHAFDRGNQVLVSRVATDLDIRDRVSMKTGRLSQVPNCPIQRSTRHSDLCACHRHETVPVSHVTTSHLISPCRRINGGSSELQII